jgi:hypothetical protein
MSQLANFYLIETSQLGELQENARIEVVKKWFGKKYIHHYDNYLSSNATQLYGHLPGHFNANPFITLISWLADEKNVNLTEGKYVQIATNISNQTESSNFIWTLEEKAAFLSLIDIDKIPFVEFNRIGHEWEGDDSDQMAEDLLLALQQIKDVFGHLESEKQVIVVNMG